MITVHFDGGLNALKLTYAYAAFQDGVLVAEGSWSCSSADLTTNMAEYFGLLAALEAVHHHFYDKDSEKIQIIGDSQLVIYQMIGKYRAKHPNIKTLHMLAVSKVDHLRENAGLDIEFIWVPREQNTYADRLCR